MQRVRTVRSIKPRGNGVRSAASRNAWTSGCVWKVSEICSISYSSQIQFSTDITNPQRILAWRSDNNKCFREENIFLQKSYFSFLKHFFIIIIISLLINSIIAFVVILTFIINICMYMDKGNLVTGAVYFLIEKVAKTIKSFCVRQVGLFKILHCSRLFSFRWRFRIREKDEKKETVQERNRRSCCKVAVICRHFCLTGCARSSGSRLSIHLSTALFLISQDRSVFK